MISATRTPPLTPSGSVAALPEPRTGSHSDTTNFDFSAVDYEIDRARLLGKGLWCSVYIAHPVASSPLPQPGSAGLTPPPTPRGKAKGHRNDLFAIKVPSRSDAKSIFVEEARVLTRIQMREDARDHIVSFYGLDVRNDSLIFEAALGGSLDTILGRLRQMTEFARHAEVVRTFSSLAHDLVSGLCFIHAAGVVHADIKPSNIVLDLPGHAHGSAFVPRARYIDFSASFVPSDSEAAVNAGGTWDYMAPEQMSVRNANNLPTFASDVWSLGMTLLAIIVGGSPYTAACGDNVFRLREAVKSGDPLGFARMDSTVQKRLTASQGMLDGLRLALQKDRSRRTTAQAWQVWLENREDQV